MMNLSLATYYADPRISRAEQEEKDADLRDGIKLVRIDFPRSGNRTLIHYLAPNKIKVGETRLRRVLEKFELQIRPRRKYVVTTNSTHDCLVCPNHIKGMVIDGINQVWTADISYIRINNGFNLFAMIISKF